MEPAGILLIVSVLLIAALMLLTLSLMRYRGTARELEAALADQTGARDRADLLLALASAVNSTLALEEVLNVALTHVGRLMGSVAGAMYLVRPGKAELYRESSYNLTTRARGGARKLDEEPIRSAVAAMRPLVVNLDERSAPGLDQGGHPQHALVVPIQRSGQLMGAMELYLNAWRELTDDQVELLNGVAAQAAIAIRHAQLFEAQEENALTDELTRLPNRRALAQRFLQEMQRARRHHAGITFVMIDLDHFKQVNDTYGHLNGDAVLAELASILSSGLRESDVCARYGGEEFALILTETGRSDGLAACRRVQERIARIGLVANGAPVMVRASFGLAATDQFAEVPSPAALVEAADGALYQAKRAGRDRVCVAPDPLPVRSAAG